MAKGKRTFQPNNRRRARVHGFRLRMRTRAGRAIVSARRGKGRELLLGSAAWLASEVLSPYRHYLERARAYAPHNLARDVENALRHLRPVPYGREVDLPGGFAATFHNAGHILGSAHVQVQTPREHGHTRIVFSGDVGRHDISLRTW